MITNTRPLYETLSGICQNKSIIFSNDQKIRIKNNLKTDDKKINKLSLEKNKLLYFLKVSKMNKTKVLNKPKKFLLVNSNKELNEQISVSFIKNKTINENKTINDSISSSPKRNVWKSQSNFKTNFSMNENKSVSNFYASYALEEVAYIVGHAPDPYLFIRDFH